MPNHFLVVGLCSRGDCDDFSKLKDLNLCEEVMPMPSDLKGIVASNPMVRFRNRNTLEFSPNCNGESGDEWERIVVSSEEVQSLIDKHGAANWYDWCPKYWGTKWGTYRTKVHEMGGDGSPVLIEFQCAWSPPNTTVMRLITEYLKQQFGFKSIRWMGHNPSCDEVRPIEVCE